MGATGAPPKPSAADAALDQRAQAWRDLERAFSKRDYEGFYGAAEALARSSYSFGRTKKPYAPLLEEKPVPPKPAAPEAAMEVWTVGEVDAGLISFKSGATVFTVVRPGSDGRGIVAFCDNRENAEMIARALSAQAP